MKKHASLILRIFFALAGLAYLFGWAITWSDQVVVPARQTVGQRVLSKPESMPIVSMDFDPNRIDRPLRVRDPVSGQEFVVTPEQIGDSADEFRVKPGIVTTLRHARPGWLVLGLLMIAPIYPIQSFRWLLLMRARGIDAGFAQAFRLTMIGSFFNYCMPGTTGGDVVKAYYAAKRKDRRTDAVMSVVFDRVAGLVGLLLLGGIAGLFMLRDPLARTVTYYIWLSAAGVALVGCVYFSGRLRRSLGLDWLLSKLPGTLVRRVDEAAVAYRGHGRELGAAIAMSVPVHLFIASATAVAGYALGLKTSFVLLLTVLPVLFLAGSVPLTYQGLGVMEGLAMALLLEPPTATPNQIVGMLLMFRVYQMVYSLVGALFLLKGDVHLHPAVDEGGEGEPGIPSQVTP